MTTTKKLSLASLVEDFSLYPRNHVDDVHITDLRRALQAGVELPPIVVDRASLRIVDGVHRRRAMLKHSGEQAVATVVLNSYPDDAAFFMDAVRLNAQHGRKLDRQDQTRIVLKMQEMKVEPYVIASTLFIPEAEVRTLAINVVYGAEQEPHPNKRGFAHLRGETLTPLQLQTIQSVRSGEVGRACRELVRMLQAQLVDLDDPKVVEQLRELSELIQKTLQSIAA